MFLMIWFLIYNTYMQIIPLFCNISTGLSQGLMLIIPHWTPGLPGLLISPLGQINVSCTNIAVFYYT